MFIHAGIMVANYAEKMHIKIRVCIRISLFVLKIFMNSVFVLKSARLAEYRVFKTWLFFLILSQHLILLLC